MSLRTIVAGVPELTDRGSPELEAALTLAVRTGAELHLVHAFQPSPGVDAVQLYAEGLRLRLESQVRALMPSGQVFCRAAHGSPARVLARAAEQLGADLVVIGHTRRGPVGGALLGTTAQRLLRLSPAPVLMLHRLLGPRVRVLLASDLSDGAAGAHQRVVPVIRSLAGDGPLQVRALYVAAYDPARSGGDGLSRAGRLLGAMAPRGLAVEARVRVAEDPGRGILDEAAEWGANLLVLGTHGRGGAARFFLGSVAEQVLQAAPCNVLVVPPAVAAAAAAAEPEAAAPPAEHPGRALSGATV